ncbi:hypothetical protein F2P47_07300 [Parvibaculum sedimenti]|uniref:Uncharacterized protein n=1 Tax=Parvibaculum sedimenti TaxID=2608632 RepID=A0A6N6VPN5_9HYPH|nr:hypothetical protein [Parvibaculum sedimenti]KAB7740844.1 hypothetical protein F2P47_07300 [Parvibaculum sedimenti]
MSDDTAAPLSGEPAKPPLSNSVKAAILMLVTMGLVLVAGFIFVLVVVVKRSHQPSEQAAGFAGRFGVSDIHVAPGETVKSVTMADGRIAIQIADDKNQEIIIVSPKTGQEIGRIRLRPLSDLASREFVPPQDGN